MAELKGKRLLATAILNLLIIGALSYTSLPEAYCSLEDSTVRYVHMSESHKTVTKVIPGVNGDGEWEMVDDRCQRGREIGRWVRVNSETVESLSGGVLVIAYTEDGKYFCEGVGEGQECTSTDQILSELG